MNMKDFGFYKGVDLGGWFSQCDYSEDRMDHFITEKDFQVIAGWGLDHVRIPVDYNVMETENGGWRTDGFRRIGKELEYAGRNGLKVVLDLHKKVFLSVRHTRNVFTVCGKKWPEISQMQRTLLLSC